MKCTAILKFLNAFTKSLQDMYAVVLHFTKYHTGYQIRIRKNTYTIDDSSFSFLMRMYLSEYCHYKDKKSIILSLFFSIHFFPKHCKSRQSKELVDVDNIVVRRTATFHTNEEGSISSNTGFT